MANYFNLGLDTTAPATPSISLAGGATYATAQLIDATIGTGDASTTGYQMKIWGDVDKANDVSIQTQENDILDPSTAPTLASSAGTSGLSAGTYHVAYTWADGYGETLDSVSASITINANDNIDVTLPAFPNGTNIKANIYIAIDASTPVFYLEGSTTTTSYSQTTTLSGTVQPPTSNTLKGSAWITFATTKQIKLSANDGSKTGYVKIRDDVWNASAVASDGIILDTTLPVVSVTSPDVSKISKIDGKNVSSFSFTVDADFVEYKVKVVSSTGATHDTGTLIPTTAGSTNMSGTGTWTANTSTINSSVYGTDLETASAGDGTKIVKVFAKDTAGNWSA